MLCRDQFGTVHFHQRLAFFYRLAGGIDVEPLDPALELGRYGVQPALVRLYRCHRPHRTGEFAQARRPRFSPPAFALFRC